MLTMRVDLYLKLMGIAKTRMGTKHLCDLGKVILASKPIKPSHILEGGEVLDVFLPFKEIRVTVLQIPEEKSVSKQSRPLYGLVEVTKEF